MALVSARRRWGWCVLLGVLCAGVPACDDDDDDHRMAEDQAFARAVPQDPVTFGAQFLVQPYGDLSCDRTDDKLAGVRELRIFNGGAFQVETFTQGLARYYRRHGLTFQTRFEPLRLSLPYVIDTDLKRLEGQLRKRFPGVDFDSDEFHGTAAELMAILEYAANLMMAPLLDFAERFGHQDPGITNLILVGEIASANILDEPDATLAGLAISPDLLKTMRDSDNEDARIWQGVHLPETFNAMLFVDAQLLGQAALRVPVVVDLVVAHEFGHTAGLVHTQDDNNLMTPTTGPGNARCSQNLDDEQLATMAATLKVGPPVVLATQPLLQDPALDKASSSTSSTNQKMSPAERWQRLRADLVGPDADPRRLLRALFGAHGDQLVPASTAMSAGDKARL